MLCALVSSLDEMEIRGQFISATIVNFKPSINLNMEYIRIPKELLSSPLWMYELSNDTKIFFIHLLNKATHKSCRKTFMREIFELDAGQVVMTQRDMAKTL
ncbi:MAG: hypothetical protein ACRCZM_04680, partial [Bacteroidales bacterium]